MRVAISLAPSPYLLAYNSEACLEKLSIDDDGINSGRNNRE
jgi:hypothetical protein